MNLMQRCRLAVSLLSLCFVSFGASGATQPASAVDSPHAAPLDITQFGAVADGKTLCTAAIQKAIDAANAAGGGQVVIPAGTYLTGPIELKSNVELHADAGAIVMFSRNHDDYPMILTSWEGRKAVVCRSPISADGATNISITGTGIFDGQGETWRTVKREKLTDQQWNDLVKGGGITNDAKTQWWPSPIVRDGFRQLLELRRKPGDPLIADYTPFRDMLRPFLVLLANCHHIVLDGPTFRNSAAWNIHPLDSDDITVRNVTIYNPLWAQNGDGIDLDSCSNVLIENSTIHAGDDDICLKSGRDEEGRKHARPTEHVVIRNCTIGWGHGGVAIGSEMSGGVRDVTVSDCTMDGTEVGLRFKTTRGRGGIVEDIHVHNIAMTNMTKTAILFDMYYQERNPKPEPVSERTPVFRNIDISDIVCHGAKQSILMKGLAELPMSNISMKNIEIDCDQGASLADAQQITLENVKIRSKEQPPFLTQNVKDLHVINLDAALVAQAGTKEQPK